MEVALPAYIAIMNAGPAMLCSWNLNLTRLIQMSKEMGEELPTRASSVGGPGSIVSMTVSWVREVSVLKWRVLFDRSVYYRFERLVDGPASCGGSGYCSTSS